MDEALRRAERRANADPSDDAALARLAMEQSRIGEMPWPENKQPMLAIALEKPWVDAVTWGAVRIAGTIVILRPGHFDRLDGYMAWLAENGVARSSFKDAHSARLAEAFNRKLIKWAAGPDISTQHRGTMTQVPFGRGLETELVKTERTREWWSVEHVRLACGMDPFDPVKRKILTFQPIPTAGACQTQGCRSTDKTARMRQCGHRLCFGCNQEHIH